MVRAASFALCFLATSLILAGCAAKPLPDIAYKKSNVSNDIAKKDSLQCWSLAQTAKEPNDVTTTKAITYALGGGLAGVAVLMASTADEQNDPKNQYRRAAHQKCMLSRGYAANGFAAPAETVKISTAALEASQPAGQRLDSKKPTKKIDLVQARKRASTQRQKQKACYTFRQCFKLCSAGELPGDRHAGNYCEYTCQNEANLC